MKHLSEEYDDDLALDEYVRRNRYDFMTAFEQQAEQLGMTREKTRHRISESEGPLPALLIERLEDCDAQIDDSIQNAIGDDLESLLEFQQQTIDRIKAAFTSGELQPNRCPACERIVRTPLARQCFWCGHDWHKA